MLFNSIIGHDKAKITLLNEIQAGRIGHAYLFVGKHGIGKSRIATSFAKKIICNNTYIKGDSELSCEDRVEKDIHPDLRVWKTEKKSIGVSDIRLWQKQVYLPPTLSSKKVFVIEQAEKLTHQAQNSLLKTLEEPPASAIFILLCSEITNILNTIISRCRVIHFSNLSFSQFSKILNNSVKDAKIITLLYYLTEGSPGQAFELVNNKDITALVNDVIKVCSYMSNSHKSKVFEVVSELVKKDCDVSLLLKSFEIIWSLAIRKDSSINDIISNSENITGRSLYRLNKDCQHILKAQKQINQYQNKQLVIEVLLFSLMEDKND